MRTTFAVLLLLVSASAMAQQPQPICLPREEMLRQLAADDQAPVARGLAATGAMVEITASPSGYWTLIATSPTGITCLIGTGEEWRAVKPGRNS